MSRSLQSNNPLIVSAFKTALFHQFLLVLLIGVVVAIAWNVLRATQYRRAVATGENASRPVGAAVPLPRADSPTGHADRLRAALDLRRDPPGPGVDATRHDSWRRATCGLDSPGWVQHLVDYGVTIWRTIRSRLPPPRSGSRWASGLVARRPPRPLVPGAPAW